MKIKPKHIIILCSVTAFLVLVILLFFGGKDRTVTLKNADKIYNESIAAITTAQDMVLNISTVRNTSINGEDFLETSQQTLAYTGLGTDSILANAQESLNIGGHTLQLSETYNGDTAYVSMDGCQFSCEITANDYMARFAPAVLITPELYGSITGTRDKKLYTVYFAEPSSGESWALEEGCEFINASGTAYISTDGNLQKSTYTVSYTIGNATVSTTVTVEPQQPSAAVALPTDTSGFISIAYLDGPRMLERATGYLLQAKKVFTAYKDNAYFQAFGDERSQILSMYTNGEEAWSALVDTNVVLTNTSRIDDISQLTKRELFFDGKYTVSTNAGESVTNADIDQDAMMAYCKNLLIGTIMLPEYITGAKLTKTDNSWRIEYAANDAFADLISTNVCQTLYQNSEMLGELAVASTTDVMECYLELDADTWMPVASGIRYSGTYTIEDVPYQLRFDAEQSYDIASTTATDTINNAAG